MVGSAPYWQRIAVLAPVWVVGAGLVGMVLLLLVRAGLDSWRELEHKRLILWGFVALCLLVVLLTYLGISIPNEE